jgi:hypothetical protein
MGKQILVAGRWMLKQIGFFDLSRIKYPASSIDSYQAIEHFEISKSLG